MKKIKSCNFSGLTRRINSIYFLRKPKAPKSTFCSIYFVKLCTNRKKKLCKITVVTKTLNGLKYFAGLFIDSELKKCENIHLSY